MRTGSRRQYSSIVDCYLKTQQQSGTASLYVGIGPVFLRAAAFWGVTFAIRNTLLDAWGWLLPSDFCRMMKRQFFDIGTARPTQAAGAAAARDIKTLEYTGLVFHVTPLVVNLAASVAAAGVARDLGAVLVRWGVSCKSASQHLTASMLARVTAGAEQRAQLAADAARNGGMVREAVVYGRSVGSTVPRRLPFSCVRIGVVMAIFDSVRMAHARKWCTHPELETAAAAA